MSVDYVLYESSLGYAMFKVTMQPDTVGNRLQEVQNAVDDLAKFGKTVQVLSFAPFTKPEQALENINDLSEGNLPTFLHTFLEANLPKPSKKHRISLGVADHTLAKRVKENFGMECQTAETSDIVASLLRGVRTHSNKLLKQFHSSIEAGDVDRAQRGLAHSYSRARVKFNVNRNDNHIIQAIATLDHIDKLVNQFAMRVREWYSWHFPELLRIVSDNFRYAQLVKYIGNKHTIEAATETQVHEMAALVGEDAGIAQQIVKAANVSMGQDVSEQDIAQIRSFADRVIGFTKYRKAIASYLITKMGVVAPNLATLIGEVVGARLISHAGSLTNLAKYPASTVQILGAEKALFRALKAKAATPKYGLIYHSSFIGRASPRDKGRISRLLANKCSMASRIDNFSDMPTTKFGEALKGQVEERLEFLATGAPPTKNAVAMKNAMDSVLADVNIDVDMDVDDEGTATAKTPKGVVPPLDPEMEDLAPAQAGAVDGDAKKEKLSKEERRRLKKEQKEERREKRRQAAEGGGDAELKKEKKKLMKQVNGS